MWVKMEKFSKTDERGRITIPQEMRERIGLERGQTLRISERDNKLVLTPVESEPGKSLEKLIGDVKFDRDARRRAEKWLRKENA